MSKSALRTPLLALLGMTAVLAGPWLALESRGAMTAVSWWSISALAVLYVGSNFVSFRLSNATRYALDLPFLATLLLVAPLWLVLPTAVVAQLGIRYNHPSKIAFNTSVVALQVLAGHVVVRLGAGAHLPDVELLAGFGWLLGLAVAIAVVTVGEVLFVVVTWLHNGQPAPGLWRMNAVEVLLAPVAGAAAMTSPAHVIFLAGALAILQRSVATAENREHAALHDPLTGLGNRSALQQHGIRRRRRDTTVQAAVMLDLDRFKFVNDTLGHAAGDLLLQEAAERLKSAVRREDLVVRLGGDEFTVLLELNSDADGYAHLEHLAERIVTELSRPYDLDGIPADVGASVGYSIGSADDDITTLLEQADAALYRAKEQRGSWVAYSDDPAVDHAPEPTATPVGSRA